MQNNQMRLMLRLAAGGYLVYLAYDLFRAEQRDWLLLGAAAVFALMGAGLVIFSLLALVKKNDPNAAPSEKGENSEK